MKQSLPKSIALDMERPLLSPGLVGLVEAVREAIDHQGAELHADELICISGAAFSNYVFDPDYNTHEEERREFSVLGEYFSNYGPWESISYYTDWEAREVNGLATDDVLKLAAFELASGRPVVTLNDSLEPDLVSAYEMSTDTRLLHTICGHTVDLSGENPNIQGDADVFDNWLLIVRPADRPDWAAPTVRQRINVLRWSVEHGVNHREFFQETRENYVPGLLGVKRFREFLDGLTDPEGVEYAERYARRLGAGRGAAGVVLPEWAESIAETLAEPGIADDIREAAAHYEAICDILADYETMVDAFADVEEEERAALDALSRATRHFPQAFEAL